MASRAGKELAGKQDHGREDMALMAATGIKERQGNSGPNKEVAAYCQAGTANGFRG